MSQRCSLSTSAVRDKRFGARSADPADPDHRRLDLPHLARLPLVFWGYGA